MTPRLIRKFCRIDAESEAMLEHAMARPGLSARAYDRILKVSRTIANLEGAAEIQSSHVSEAVHYRSLIGLTGPEIDATPPVKSPARLPCHHSARLVTQRL